MGVCLRTVILFDIYYKNRSQWILSRIEAKAPFALELDRGFYQCNISFAIIRINNTKPNAKFICRNKIFLFGISTFDLKLGTLTSIFFIYWFFLCRISFSSIIFLRRSVQNFSMVFLTLSLLFIILLIRSDMFCLTFCYMTVCFSGDHT